MFNVRRLGEMFLIIILMLTILVGTASADKPIIIKLSHSATAIMQQGLVAEYFKEIVEERSEGRILVEHYPQCLLSSGNATRQLEMVISGAIEMSLETSAKYAFLDPRVEVISLPFIFEDMEHYYKVLSSPTVLAPIFEKLENKGMHVVKWHPRVPRQFMNNVRPVRTPEDMEGLRVRTMSGPVYINTFASIGAKPTPLDWSEVYTALELNVVDAIEPDLASFNQMKFYEVAKYVTKWDYSMDAFLEVFNKGFWDSLSREDQLLLEKASEDAWEYAKKIAVEMDEKALQEMYDMELNVEILDLKEKQVFADLTGKVWDDFAKKNGNEIVNAILNVK